MPEQRTYQIAVCALCGSDNIFSTDHDSWCDDCREWMNADLIEVAPVKPASDDMPNISGPGTRSDKPAIDDEGGE